MSVQRHEVERIAHLARLRLEDDEVEHLTGEMNRILEYADRLRGAGDYRTGDGEPEAAAADPAPHLDPSARELPPPVRLAPDPLVRAVEEMAPLFREGFFVVPPPPGVTGPDGGLAPGAAGTGDGEGG